MKSVPVKISVFIALIVAGFALSVICLKETGITSLLTYHDGDEHFSLPAVPLLPGDMIRGEFQAAYDNLGMVKLRVRTYNRINTTHIQFVIREKGSTAPIATNTYTVDRFADGLLYPFGFPVIPDSKGKTYVFTLESVDGTADNAIGIIPGYHNIATQYVFGKSEILSHIPEKIRSMALDPYMILYTSMFLVPVFAFLFKRYTYILMLYTIIVYTYIPVSMHSNTILAVAGEVIGITLFSAISASRIYIAALVMLAQIPVLIVLGQAGTADRAATLIFFLILIGGIISVVQLKKK